MSLVWEGALVGLAGGAVVTLYRVALKWAEGALRGVADFAVVHPWTILCWAAVLACILLVVGRLLVWEPSSQGSGIPQVDAEVLDKVDMPWWRVLVAKFSEGTLCTLAGLSMGREGPSVQLGGMAGKAVSRGLRRGRGEERLLVTCGAAAGMAAAFHAPLTGVMFALEEIHKTFNAAVIVSVMSAAVVSDLLVSQVLGLEPSLSILVTHFLPHADYVLVVAMGLLMGLVGALHNVGMFCSQDVFSRLRGGAPYTRLAIPFALCGVATFVVPQLTCGGDAILGLLEGPEVPALGVLVVLLVGKYLLTTVCFGSGAPGGTLFPLVVIGALTGAAFFRVAQVPFGLEPAFAANFMMLGVAGMFSGAIRAPVTGVVLAFELTGSLDTLLPVSIVSVIAYVTANVLHVDAYYEHLLGRMLGVSVEAAHASRHGHGRQLQSHVVEAGSDLAGSYLGDVRLPEHLLVVTVTRCGQSFIPDRDTRIEPSDKLLVLTDDQTPEDARDRLSAMCRARFARRE